MTIFRDRAEAGEQLAALLPATPPDQTVVIALPRGGVPVAAPIAEKLDAPLDVLLIRKVGAPLEPELAVGAVSDGEGMQVTINAEIAGSLGLSDADVRQLAEEELPELERRRALYFGHRPAFLLKDKTVIVVDDGVATGATARSALRLVRQQAPARLLLALPVAPQTSLDILAADADQTICLATPDPFRAVGNHYHSFEQVDDQTVIDILQRVNSGHRLSQPG